MNVAYITMQFPNPREVFASNEIKELKSQSVSVCVHSYRNKHKQFKNLIKTRNINGIPLSFYSIYTFIKAPYLLTKYISEFIFLIQTLMRFHIKEPRHLFKSLLLILRTLEIFESINKNPPDIVHIYWSHYPSQLGILIKKYKPEQIVTISLTAYDLIMEYKGSKCLAKKADAIITHCKKNIKKINNFGISEEKISLIYRGVEDKYLQDKAEIEKTPFSIISVGALIPRKGMQDVLRAFSIVKKEFLGATLTILGSGKEMNKLKKYALKKRLSNIFFKGHVTHKEVMEEMQKSEIFLLMSRDDRIPNVAKEAIASFCHPVVTNTIGIDELILDGKTGDIVPISGFAEAASAIKSAYLNKQNLRKSKRLGLELLKKRFSLKSEMISYVKLWSGLLYSQNHPINAKTESIDNHAGI